VNCQAIYQLTFFDCQSKRKNTYEGSNEYINMTNSTASSMATTANNNYILKCIETTTFATKLIGYSNRTVSLVGQFCSIYTVYV